MASNNAQAAQKAVETIKETAANIGAAANTGTPANSSLEKTKTTIQEKIKAINHRNAFQNKRMFGGHSRSNEKHGIA
ncbi:hypothetical protein JHK87_004322 [Glycine soja]|nr:hypothetical protein JHK87_004322 [Glycine soja]